VNSYLCTLNGVLNWHASKVFTTDFCTNYTSLNIQTVKKKYLVINKEVCQYRSTIPRDNGHRVDKVRQSVIDLFCQLPTTAEHCQRIPAYTDALSQCCM